MTFALSADEREDLASAIPADSRDLTRYAHIHDDPDWRRLEEAFFGILAERARIIEQAWPTRGNKDYLLHGQRQETTQANEIGRLTPKPIEEHVPGAWNFEEPRPGVHPFVELAEKNLRDRRNR